WSNAVVTFVTGEGATQIAPIAASGWDMASPVPIPKKDGLSFYGWYENANYEGEPFILGYTSAINSDLTLYARFEPCMDIPYMSVNYDTFGITGTQVKDFYDGVEDKTYHRALISNGSISFSINANGFEFTPSVDGVTLTEAQTSDGTVYSASGLTKSFTLTGDAKIKILEHSAQSVIERLGEINPDDYNETTIERYPQSGGIKTLTVQYPSFISVSELNSLNRSPDFVSFEAYDTYVITLNTMGGDPLDPVIADPADAPVTVWITTPDFEGHTFAGWFQDEDYSTPFIPRSGTTEATVVTGNITLYAKWD
ncbi:MAG: InlB B-repeat-containing protein, partial [Firmicutes bacterium]|nr:InlB B-repeat-containing protein [Bacillota bacterium]